MIAYVAVRNCPPPQIVTICDGYICIGGPDSRTVRNRRHCLVGNPRRRPGLRGWLAYESFDSGKHVSRSKDWQNLNRKALAFLTHGLNPAHAQKVL